MIFWGCQPQPRVPENLKSDENLTKVSNVLALADMNAVGFEWDRVTDPHVAGFLIYRGEPGGKLDRVGAVGNRFSTHYVDTQNLLPGRDYLYRISLYTVDGRESIPSANVAVKTRPLPPAISFVQSVPGLPRMSKIIFRPHPDERITGYVFERRTAKAPQWRTIGKLQGRLHAEFFDTGLEDGMEYEYRIIAHTHDGLQTEPSDIVITVTKPLPPAPANLNATQDKPKSITLSWERLSNDDNGTYRLYASRYEKLGYSAIADIKKANAATEKLNEDGAVRYYKISYIDKDGLESLLPEAAVRGQTLAKPAAPRIVKLVYENKKITLDWEAGDARNQTFTVRRVTVAGLIAKDEKVFKAQKQLSLTDSQVKPGITYQYTIEGIDEHGIASHPSDSARITIDASGTR